MHWQVDVTASGTTDFKLQEATSAGTLAVCESMQGPSAVDNLNLKGCGTRISNSDDHLGSTETARAWQVASCQLEHGASGIAL